MSQARAVQVIKMPNRQQTQENAARDDMRSLLEEMVVRMVGSADNISVSFIMGEKTTVFKVDCPREVLGRLIGSKGKNISALRTVVSAMMWQVGIRAIIEIPYFKPEEK
jgi:predicted RNA-binding protein YlqC (UPF0109 family)